MDLKKLFPNGSKSFLALHGFTDVYNSLAAPKLERDIGDGPLAEGQIQEAAPARILVRVESFRRRLIDEDNLCEKYAVDCCRYAGLLPSDAPNKTKIEVSQTKVYDEKDERTEITITPAP